MGSLPLRPGDSLPPADEQCGLTGVALALPSRASSFALHANELVVKREVFGGKIPPRSKRGNQGSEDDVEHELKPLGSTLAARGATRTEFVGGTGTS